ncbi:hypothetical protein Pcinc_028847 [Petrolisthes cinctipes]|uniref:Uncharacterized protein n=1 Tax=Petrolisthes cinctipes TaxID=88211 RepID=A0AAE1K8C6_PETCI|nr:hypothetical protein Pcinc_028847 [Petrolisthes cinctipes]
MKTGGRSKDNECLVTYLRSLAGGYRIDQTLALPPPPSTLPSYSSLTSSHPHLHLPSYSSLPQLRTPRSLPPAPPPSFVLLTASHPHLSIPRSPTPTLLLLTPPSTPYNYSHLPTPHSPPTPFRYHPHLSTNFPTHPQPPPLLSSSSLYRPTSLLLISHPF